LDAQPAALTCAVNFFSDIFPLVYEIAETRATHAPLEALYSGAFGR